MKVAWSELRAECRHVKPGVKAEFEEEWRDIAKDVEAHLKKQGKKATEGEGLGGGEDVSRKV